MAQESITRVSGEYYSIRPRSDMERPGCFGSRGFCIVAGAVLDTVLCMLCRRIYHLTMCCIWYCTKSTRLESWLLTGLHDCLFGRYRMGFTGERSCTALYGPTRPCMAMILFAVTEYISVEKHDLKPIPITIKYRVSHALSPEAYFLFV